jgi:hypothetical protein
VQTTFPGTTTQNTVLQGCADFAVSSGYYYGFQAYYLSTPDEWICRAYYNLRGHNSSPAYFNVANSDVGIAFGYQIES